MTQLKTINDAVYLAEDQIVSISMRDVEFLKDRLRQTGLKRNRICAHKTIDDTLQEMIIAFARGSYIRPSKHIGKEESIHVLEGTGYFVFFDKQGEITNAIAVGDAETGLQEYVRTPVEKYHTLLITSDYFVVQETTQGPFTRADTIFAEWAPEDQNVAEVDLYMQQLEKRVKTFLQK